MSEPSLDNPTINQSVPWWTRLQRWSRPERLAILLVLLTAALAMSPNVADPDLWGHVQFGRDLLRDGSVPAATTYSYTAEGYRWVNHENLSEIIMAIVADSLGPIGLVFGKFLLSLLVIAIIFRWNLAAGSGLIVSSIMTLLVAANLGYHWSIRPQLSSFVGFTFLVLLFQFCFRGWRDHWNLPLPRQAFIRPGHDATLDDGQIDIKTRLGYDSFRIRFLWLLVPLMAVWANSHGGFVAGLAVIAFYLAMRAVEALFRGGGLGPQSAGWGLARRMILMGFVAVLATFFNPYGPGLHRWLAESLGSPRPEISDWANSQLWTLVGMKLWLLVACCGFAVAFSRRRPDATQLVILGLLCWQSMSHFRHVPFFAIAAGFWMGPHLQSAMQRFSTTSSETNPSPRAQLALRMAMILALVLVSGGLGQRLSDLQVERDKYPVDAIDFMRDHELHGRIVVTYDWAQYTIAAMCSDDWSANNKSRVAFDGRFRTCYPQVIVDQHFDWLYGDAPHMPRQRSPGSPEIDPARVLTYRQPDLVLLRRFGERTETHMNQNTDNWVLLYQDAIAQVWGQRRKYDDATMPTWLAPSDRVIHNRRCNDSVTWPAIYHPSRTAIQRHLASQSN